MTIAQTVLELLVLLIVVVAAAKIAQTYFRTDKEQEELWKKTAESANEALNTALRNKNISQFKELLTQDVSRFWPKSPYRVDGQKQVIEHMKDQLGTTEGPPEPMYAKNVQTYQNCVIISYSFKMKGKQDDKPFDFTGKTTRVWARGQGSRWYLAHEHISMNPTS